MNKYLTAFFLLVLSLMFSNCSLTKTYKLMKQGSFDNANFFEEIDFDFLDNLILVDLKIEGNIYTCVFDSGAEVSLLDAEIFSEISHNEVANKDVTGAAGVKSEFRVLEIPKVKIGNLNFNDLVVISSDLSPINNLYKCEKKIHGIIGSNLMRKAKCRIDYQSQKIWLSDKLSSFDDLEDDIVLDLDCGKTGSAYIPVSLDGVKEMFTFDTGKAAKMQTNIKIFNKLLENKEELAFTQSKGISGVTLNGIQHGTTNYTLIEKIEMGGIVLSDQIIEIENDKISSSLIGNDVWKNFIVTTDWDNCKLYLQPIKKMKPDTLDCFEYDFNSTDSGNGLKLGNKWIQHSSELNINTNNKIISIEGINLSTMNLTDYCNFLDKELPVYKEKNTLSIVLLNDGKEKEILLTKKRLLPK